MERKEITIKPVTKAKFAGISGHSNSVTAIEGAQLGKGGYKTGLTREEEETYEKLLNLEKHTLNCKNEKFWGNILGLTLPNDKPYTFIVASPLDELRLKVLMEHSAIANNELELAKSPRALFYIEDTEAKAKVEEVAIDYLFKATEAFMNMAADEKKGFLKLYGKRGVDQMSERVIKTELFKEINKEPKKFLAFVEDPDIELKISIEDMLEAGTLSKKGSYYNFQNEVIGSSLDSVISFFKEPRNQSVKIAAVKDSKTKLKK